MSAPARSQASWRGSTGHRASAHPQLSRWRGTRRSFRAISVSDDTPIALAATQAGGERVMRHPTFGLWPVSLRDDLAIALSGGVRKIVAWTDTHGAAAVVFDSASYDPFFNLNAPEDRDAAEALLRQMAA